RDNREDLAMEVSRLVNARSLDGVVKPKILLDSIDSSEFQRLLNGEEEGEFLNSALFNAFWLLRDCVGELADDQKLHTFLYRLQNQALIIRLDVSEARDAFKLFETINNRGLRLNHTD